MKLNRSGEDYLKTILILEEQNGSVRSVDVVERLHFSKPSVSKAIRLLQEGGIISEYPPGTYPEARLFPQRNRIISDDIMNTIPSREGMSAAEWLAEQMPGGFFIYRADETMELLKEQGLDSLKDELATSLPYGLQRRLEIARALATKPKLLLLDEPAAGMNPQETIELADFVRQIREKYNLTVFLIEHHMDLVMNISDYIYVIDFGSEIARGVPKEIQNNQRVIDAYLGVDEDG